MQENVMTATMPYGVGLFFHIFIYRYSYHLSVKAWHSSPRLFYFYTLSCIGLCAGANIKMKRLKFIFFVSILLLSCLGIKAQQRILLAPGITLVSNGASSVIEDDNKQCSISITIAQKNIDQRNGEMLYEVACKGVTKTIAKSGLKKAISIAVSSAGFPTIAQYASSASGYIYDAVCEYYSKKYNN